MVDSGRYWRTARIVDEYGREVRPDEMLRIIRRDDVEPREIQVPEGYGGLSQYLFYNDADVGKKGLLKPKQMERSRQGVLDAQDGACYTMMFDSEFS